MTKIPHPEDGHRPSLPRRIAALLMAPVFLLGWGAWLSLSPLTGAGAAGSLELAACDRALEPGAVAVAGEAGAAEAAARSVQLARLGGLDPRDRLARAFPEAHGVIGMLSRDRDIEDYEAYADRDGAIGAYYASEAALARSMRPLRPIYEAAYASAWDALCGIDLRRERPCGLPPRLALPGELWFPGRDELKRAHQYALDVFFARSTMRGEAETGPAIRSLCPGLVVCAAAGWSGGLDGESWRGGGLSPAAGNGLVVYDPAARRYVSYFHLSSLARRAGDIVRAGDILGRGGNSGVHARMAGHGGHVHVEIFDCARGGNLSIYELYDLLKP
jgi:hypothetical protein